MEELRPCPFCGTEPALVKVYSTDPKYGKMTGFRVHCPKCDIYIRYNVWQFRVKDRFDEFLGHATVTMWKAIRSAADALKQQLFSPGYIIQICPACGHNQFGIVQWDQKMAQSGGCGIDIKYTIGNGKLIFLKSSI